MTRFSYLLIKLLHGRSTANTNCITCLIFKVDIRADLGAEGGNDIGVDWGDFNLRFIIRGLLARPGLSNCFS